MKPADFDQLRKFAEAVRTEMERCAFCMVPLAPSIKPDVALAIQVGIAIVLEKPLIVVVLQGAHVPKRLREIADAVIEADSLEAAAEETRAAIRRITSARKVH